MEYPHLMLDERVNKLNLKLIGVSHSSDFFEAHEEFFREQISSSSAIFIEDGISFSRGKGFYAELAKIASAKPSPVYIPDSHNSLHVAAELGQVAIGTGLIVDTIHSVTSKKQSRRDLLRNILKMGGGTFLLSGTTFFPSLYAIDYASDETVIIDDALTYGTIVDYRNLLIAENLDRISKVVSFGEKQIPFFIGNAHVKGISAYLRNPMLRKKRLLYLPQDLATETQVRKYVFDMNKWQSAKTF